MDTTKLRRKMAIKLKYAFYLFKKWCKGASNPADEIFAGCDNLAMLVDVTRLDNTFTRELFLKGTDTGLSNLCEFYIAVLLEAEWVPRKGYDVRRILEYKDGLKVLTVEVRSCRPYSEGDDWGIRITDSNGELRADYIVAVCMMDTYNPAYAYLFAIPREALEPAVAKDRASREQRQKDNPNWKRKDPRVRICIRKHSTSRKTGQLNAWWQYYVSEHIDLDTVISNRLDIEPRSNWEYCQFTVRTGEATQSSFLT